MLDQERKIVVIFLSVIHILKISKTLRLNIHYLILFKIPKNQLSQIYIDQAINIEKEKFYKIISDLNRYENILLDLNNPVEQLQIRKNLNEILIK